MEERLEAALAARWIEPGLAQRVRLVFLLQGPVESHVGRGQETAFSGETLGRMLGLSRAAVHKHIEQLRAVGFSIESAAGSGYRLTTSPDDLVVGEAFIPHLLRSIDPRSSQALGLPYIYRPACESTNPLMRSLLASQPDLRTGAVTITDHQSAGKGRLGRGWSGEPGRELTFSVLLRPSLAPGQAHLLRLGAALAVARTLEARPGLAGRVRVKWPNDVLIDGAKVCGILVEGSMDVDRLHWVIAGIGVNVNSDPEVLERAITERADEGGERRPRPGSLRVSLGGLTVPRAPLLAALLKEAGEVWAGLEEGPPGIERMLSGLRDLDALLGTPVEVYGGPGRQEAVAAGEAVGIGPDGQLLVRTAGGETVPVVVGDVSLRRPSR
jgi:BirA family biotin operon repressor/biotin-[acetyl-CoA-carboxylase] ligase